MTRLLSTLQWDVRSQVRQGIYLATLVVIGIWVATLAALPREAVAWLLPFAIFMDLSVFGLYFMADILYLEKSDGVLNAIVVTPLRRSEYLLAKLASLALLAVLATVIVVLAATLEVDSMAFGAVSMGAARQVNWLWLLIGVVMNSWLMVLIGFLLAVRYNNISEFLIPSLVFMMPSQLPLLDYFGIWTHWLIYLVPTQPTMILIEAGLRPVPTWQVVYALIYLAGAGALVWWLALAAFDRFVIRNERMG